MTTLLTISRFKPRPRRIPQWLVASGALLIAVAAPAAACEKSLGRIEAAPIEERSVATFTGEFVNGVPVYRLPSITVVARRPTDVAKTQRNDSQLRAARSRTSSAPTGAAGQVASDSRETAVAKPCVAKDA